MSVMKLRRVKLAAIFAIIIIMFGGLFWTLNKLGVFLSAEDVQEVVNNPGNVTLKALKQDEMRIATDTAFLLTTENSIDEKTVKDNLKISPAFTYSLEEKAEGREYKIIPASKLTENTIYKLSFDTTGQKREQYSWAFQSKGSFGVLRTLPRNKATYVSGDTGIEVTFSYENIDMSNIADYFSIEPEVEGRFELNKKTLVFVPKGLTNSTLYTVTLKKRAVFKRYG